MKHIAFDLGAESGRAIVGEITNGKLVETELHRFPTKGIYINGSLRWDIFRLFSELKTGLTAYVKMYGDEPCTMGVDTWGVDIGFLDKNGELIGVPYHYRDVRNLDTTEKIDNQFGLDRLYEHTGVQQLTFNTLNQIVAATELKDTTLIAADKMLFIGDILHYFLCGSVTSEASIASTSNMYSAKDNCWVADVLKVFGINENWMPEVKDSGTVLGAIRADLASETGISKQCLVIAPPIHDTAAAATAVPGEGDIAYISSGTWSLVGLELEKAQINAFSKQENIANYAGAFGKILFLKNVAGLWLIQGARKHWAVIHPDLEYNTIVKKAEKATPFAGFIDPDDEMFLNPKNMVASIIEYLKKSGQSAPDADDIGGIARIIFESLALKYRYVFELLGKASGKRIEKIHMIGGGIQNAMLTQFTANALGADVMAGPVEATAAGNILMQAVGTGEIGTLDELRAVVRRTHEPVRYVPKDIEEWQKQYDRFTRVCLLNG